MDNLEGFFDSLTTATVAGKDDLRDLVEADLALTKTVADLTNTNTHLMKKVEGWKNSGVGGGESQLIPQMHWERRHVPAGHNAFAPETGGSTIGRGGVGGGGAVNSIPERFERWSDAEG